VLRSTLHSGFLRELLNHLALGVSGRLNKCLLTLCLCGTLGHHLLELSLAAKLC
jgi:hypothetical protein